MPHPEIAWPTTFIASEFDGGWVVRIGTPGDERPLKIYINGGLAFDDYPDFAIPPDWRLCPACGVNPRHKHAIFFCAWCGHKLPDYPAPDPERP